MSIIFGISHRPPQVGGFDRQSFNQLTDFAHHVLVQYQPTQVISDMSLGWNLSLAQAALDLEIPLIAAIPYRDQSNPWHDPLLPQLYASIRDRAYFIVSQNIPWSKPAMTQFTFRVIDHCDLILAIWNCTLTSSTEPIQRNCIHYARSISKPIINVWPDWLEHRNS